MQKILGKINASPFKRSNYKVNIPLSTFHSSIMMYLDDYKKDNGFIKEDVFESTPQFQRNNDKWTYSMKVSFIENLLMGCGTTLMLYEVCPEGKIPPLEKCFILDGLQRITAIHEFVVGDVLAFGETFEALNRARIVHSLLCMLTIKIYSFPTEKEAVEFYISINENITHSKEDILKAKNYLKGL